MSAAAAADTQSAPTPIPLKLRLKAWWEGIEVGELLARAGDDSGDMDSEAAASAAGAPAAKDESGEPITRAIWDESRIAAVEALWGHGHVRPGGDTFTLNFVRPMGLTPAMSIIDMRAGLGGAARALVDTFGLWIAGYEPVEALATAGHERSIYGGMARKAPIQAYDPTMLELKANRYDAAIAFELFSEIRDKNGLFEKVIASLKEPGQIMFTEFALKSHGEPAPEIVAWRETEPEIADLWTLKEYREMCEEAGLDLRICDDFSDDYRQAALTGWAATVQQFKPGAHEPEVLERMLKESERWGRRLAAIDSGALRVVRIHALKRSAELK